MPLLRAIRAASLFLAFAASLLQAVLWLHAMPLVVAQAIGLGDETFGFRLLALLGYLIAAGLGGLLGWWCLVALDEPVRIVQRALGVALLLSALILLAPDPPADPAAAPAILGLAYWPTRPRAFLDWAFGPTGAWLLLAQPLLLGLARLTLHAGPAVTPPEAR
ncbi:hypothetical protein [Roseicella aquatilis]|uniref:Uncharacterized protein n=1 Tax=Roseicella aquatilis TaxID=2527868 RepID=A0A4R4DUK8_9PROT|nr:hypothetical protein [Roseicella aquatilis]TCZ64794.1 hypothetical protein EXY23_05285 [Roseicella aquatilis]